MSRFAPTDRVAVTEAGEVDAKSVAPGTDAIFIRPKMDFGTKQRVQARLLAISLGGRTTAQIDVVAYQLALACENIVDWQGPGFEGKPCTPQNVEALDGDDPLLRAALKAIAERNPGPLGPKGSRPSTKGGAPSSEAGA